jgi:hypothetical protein
MHNFDGQISRGRMALQLRTQDGLRANQHDTYIMVSSCLNGAFDLGLGCPV